MALNKTWCPNHFICANNLCKRSLEQNGFVEEQDRLYCENCYETHFAPSCAKCFQRIKGVNFVFFLNFSSYLIYRNYFFENLLLFELIVKEMASRMFYMYSFT